MVTCPRVPTLHRGSSLAMTFTGSGDQIARVAPHLRDMGVVDDVRSEFYRHRAGRLTAAGDVLTDFPEIQPASRLMFPQPWA